MAKESKYEKLSNTIVDVIGGAENISYFTHCVTRLRFNIKDKSKVKLEEINILPGVMGSQWQNDQLQVIIGQGVSEAYNLIRTKTGLGDTNEDEDQSIQKKNKVTIGSVLEIIAGCLTPLIPILIGAGTVRIGLMLVTIMGLVSDTSSTYQVISFVADAAFYFLPVFVGATTAMKFKASVGLGMLTGAMLIHPSFINMVTEGTNITIFGLPVLGASYASSVIPAMMAVFLMAYIERFFRTHIPEMLRTILVPTFTILIMIPITLVVIAPLGSYIGEYLSAGVIWLYNTTGFFGVAVFATILPFVVMTGMHMAFTPYVVQMMSSVAYEPIFAISMIVSNLNQSAACVAVGLKTKDAAMKSIAFSSAFTAFVGGISEPAMYGVTLKLKKPMIGAMIGNFVGGAIGGLLHVHMTVMAGTLGIFGIPAFIGENVTGTLISLLIAIAIGWIVAFAATLFMYKEETQNIDEQEMELSEF